MSIHHDTDQTQDPMAAQARRIVQALDPAARVRLLSGAGMWSTEEAPGAPAVVLANGPNGVGKQVADADHVGIGETVPATCFPAGAALGSTWDEELLEEVGAAMGREARAEGVGVLLGPGLNIKRHPGGGRTFEYLSEDPFLAGKAAAALVRGVQSEGVGASVKHFAGNSQETSRMRLDSVIDERTLREVYLAGFEIAVREGRPWTVMTSYNLLNGEHTGESRHLLAEILRGEWSFDGLVMSDWMAVFDRVAGVRAGLDLEMPGGRGAWDARVLRAVDLGELSQDDVDRSAARVVALSLRAEQARAEAGPAAVDRDAHHALTRRAAAAGTVLLTNDGLLPLSALGRVAVIGAAAEHPRFQGVGSSRVNPWRTETLLAALRDRLPELAYTPGYDPVTGTSSGEQRQAAVAEASSADAVVLVLGVPAGLEAEGVDRTDLAFPSDLNDLVGAVVAANPRTAVVLVNGAPFELPWADEPAALIEAYLGGQAAGAAIADVLLGDSEPGGRLAESLPVRAADLAASAGFPTTAPTQALYRETSNVGYRFHDTWDVAPRFPFGHGLTYTSFSYGTPHVTGEGTDLVVTVPVTNTGARAGSEVVQLYVHDTESTVHRPAQELKGFARVRLAPGQSCDAELRLDRRSFAVYDVATGSWLVETGGFELRVGASSRDIRASITVHVESDDVITPVPAPSGPVATGEEMAALLQRPVPALRPLLPYTTDSTIEDLAQTWLGRRLRSLLLVAVRRQVPTGGDQATKAMIEAVLAQMPLRGLVAAADGRLGLDTLDRIVAVLNATSPTARRAGARLRNTSAQRSA
ncbi:beta-glucosidase [Actinocorallia herbida]|uniref:Exo-alpha-(1->6)-L-arabinopyranosidase n=1 Tax=Actinocorallia herbida TaxID=58109 RepID=A0A3N1D309_9ACTN|nr:glycoside hydrolase family 3 C-terminal domain-containing protein [Actinocorallia herbida]ROO87866.1 beta-glucosidase [Actinocorallia herbida]